MHEIPVAGALLGVAAAALVAAAVRRGGFGVTSVTSTSMLPTLRPGDRRLVLRSRLARLRRGDVVVAWSRELGTDVVKRVIGLPGDVVTIHADGSVAIDGASLAEPYVAFPGGREGLFRVPTGGFLLLGDNRAASSDSRQWIDPYLPQTALRGRLVRRPSRSRAPSVGDAPGLRPPGLDGLADGCRVGVVAVDQVQQGRQDVGDGRAGGRDGSRTGRRCRPGTRRPRRPSGCRCRRC